MGVFLNAGNLPKKVTKTMKERARMPTRIHLKVLMLAAAVAAATSRGQAVLENAAARRCVASGGQTELGLEPSAEAKGGSGGCFVGGRPGCLRDSWHVEMVKIKCHRSVPIEALAIIRSWLAG
jgi:hypothetical protein